MRAWKVESVESTGDTEIPLRQTAQAQDVYLVGGGLTNPQILRLSGLSSSSREMFQPLYGTTTFLKDHKQISACTDFRSNELR